jgi:hypothetical protein
MNNSVQQYFIFEHCASQHCEMYFYVPQEQLAILFVSALELSQQALGDEATIRHPAVDRCG